MNVKWTRLAIDAELEFFKAFLTQSFVILMALSFVLNQKSQQSITVYIIGCF